MNNVLNGVVVLSKEKYKELEANGKLQPNTLYFTSSFIDAAAIANMSSFSILKVDTLPPESEGKTNILYLTPDTEFPGTFKEWILVDSKWELIGTTDVKWDNYYTKEGTENLIDEKLSLLKVPTKISELDNDTGFITKNVKDILTVKPVIEDKNSISIDTNGIVQSTSGVSVTDATNTNQIYLTMLENGNILLSHRNNAVDATKNDYSLEIGADTLNYIALGKEPKNIANSLIYGASETPNANDSGNLIELTTKDKNGISTGSILLSTKEKPQSGTVNGTTLNITNNNGNTPSLNLADLLKQNTVNINSNGTILRLIEGNIIFLALPNKDGVIATVNDIKDMANANSQTVYFSKKAGGN